MTITPTRLAKAICTLENHNIPCTNTEATALQPSLPETKLSTRESS